MGVKLQFLGNNSKTVNKNRNLTLEMPVKNQLQGMLAVFGPLDRAQSKKSLHL
jgi:hypothetical protein